MTLVPNETEQALNRQYDVYAAAREEYRKKIAEQAAEIDRLGADYETARDAHDRRMAEVVRLRAALRDIHAAAGNNHLIANIARAALGEKP